MYRHLCLAQCFGSCCKLNFCLQPVQRHTAKVLCNSALIQSCFHTLFFAQLTSTELCSYNSSFTPMTAGWGAGSQQVPGHQHSATPRSFPLLFTGFSAHIAWLTPIRTMPAVLGDTRGVHVGLAGLHIFHMSSDCIALNWAAHRVITQRTAFAHPFPDVIWCLSFHVTDEVSQLHGCTMLQRCRRIPQLQQLSL